MNEIYYLELWTVLVLNNVIQLTYITVLLFINIKFNGMQILDICLMILVINLGLAKKNRKIVDKERELFEYLVEEEEYL